MVSRPTPYKRPDDLVIELPNVSTYRKKYVAKARSSAWQGRVLEYRIYIHHEPQRKYDWYSLVPIEPELPNASSAKRDVIRALEWYLWRALAPHLEAADWEVDVVDRFCRVPFSHVSGQIL